jgi:translation initiation factor 3 subunit E
LYNFDQFQYTYGNYSGAAVYHFRVLSTDNDLNTSAHWGKLASDILTGKLDVALEELNTLWDVIDSRSPSSLLTSAEPAALTQLHSRTWHVHWSLCVYFNHEQGRTTLLETFLSPTYLNTIQTSCPWIRRYLTTAAILCRKTSAAGGAGSRVRHSIREIIKVIQTEEYQYQDPVTIFLKELYVEFDFEAAQRELTLAEKVVADDFFLGEFREQFLDNARYLISEAYCQIHQRIDIEWVGSTRFQRMIWRRLRDLLERLNLSKDEGEKWIVNLIRETRMGADAKIDLEKVHILSAFPLRSLLTHHFSQNVIEIHRLPLPIYQSVIEKHEGWRSAPRLWERHIARPPQAGGQQVESKSVAVIDEVRWCTDRG